MSKIAKWASTCSPRGGPREMPFGIKEGQIAMTGGTKRVTINLGGLCANHVSSKIIHAIVYTKTKVQNNKNKN